LVCTQIHDGKQAVISDYSFKGIHIVMVNAPSKPEPLPIKPKKAKETHVHPTPNYPRSHVIGDRPDSAGWALVGNTLHC
jgi:hypothetical protein